MISHFGRNCKRFCEDSEAFWAESTRRILNRKIFSCHGFIHPSIPHPTHPSSSVPLSTPIPSVFDRAARTRYLSVGSKGISDMDLDFDLDLDLVRAFGFGFGLFLSLFFSSFLFASFSFLLFFSLSFSACDCRFFCSSRGANDAKTRTWVCNIIPHKRTNVYANTWKECKFSVNNTVVPCFAIELTG